MSEIISQRSRTLEEKINNALIIDKEAGIYKCHRSIFTDPELFELEMENLRGTGRSLPTKVKSPTLAIIILSR
jgi:hypothetical protein